MNLKKPLLVSFYLIALNLRLVAQYNYAEGLQKTMFFYEVQRSGKMESDNRVDWRGDSHVNDGKYLGIDLSGGWYDAGDNPKWNNTMAFAGSTLAWSGFEYREGYRSTNQMVHLKRNLKWVCDYFVKCHTYTDINDVSTYKIYTDIGKFLNDNNEDKYWAPHEVMETLYPARLAAWGDKDAPATANVAAMAATLASSAVIFYQEGEAVFADKILGTAERLYKFATTYKQLKKKTPNGTIIDVGSGIDNGFDDQICWAAIWLDKAEKLKSPTFGDFYKNEAKTWGNTIWFHENYSFHGTEDFGPACYIMLSKLFPADNADYVLKIEKLLNRYVSAPKSPGGLSLLLNEWGTLRHANNAAFLGFVYGDWKNNSAYTGWAKSQLDYSLGSNPQNRSYLVGFQPAGKSIVRNLHHSTAHGVYAGWQHKIESAIEYDPYAKHILYGGLIGGPNYADVYQTEGVENYARSEVTLDYNAGITGNMARMSEKAPGGSVLSNFPLKETREDEFFVEALVTGSGSNFTEIKAFLNNRSRWPAVNYNQMSFRYYFTKEGGATISASLTSSEGATISQPQIFSGDVQYVTISFPNINILPGGQDDIGKLFYKKEAIFKITSTGAWNNGNDWSFVEVAKSGKPTKVTKATVYNAGTRLFGDEPIGNGTAPSVSINLTSTEFLEGNSAGISLVTSSPGSTITKAELFSNGVKVGESTSSPFTINYNSLLKGSYSLTAKVTNAEGVSTTSSPVSITVLEKSNYNYAEGLQKTMFFYEVQRSGKTSSDSRVDWRGDSHVNDGKYLGIDLSGGWYDAGDNPKWNSTMGFAGSTLAWSGFEYREGYRSTNQMVHLKRNLAWVCDYFIKCHTYTDINDVSTYKIYTDIGKYRDDNREDKYWAPHEVMETLFPERLAAWADKDAPATSNVAAMAATLASSATIFYQEGDKAYADKLLASAERLYKFAITYKQLKKKAPNGTIIDVGSGVDNGFDDQICWAAIWLDKAAKLKNPSFGDSYKNEAKTWGNTLWFHENYSFHGTEDFGPACLIMLCKLFPEDNTAYKTKVEMLLDRYVGAQKSPGGLTLLLNEWGSLRHANNAAFLAFAYGDWTSNTVLKDKYTTWAKRQIDYTLGSNPQNRSYLTGYQPAGKSVVRNLHHSTAHGVYAGWNHKIESAAEYMPFAKHVLYGGMVGGPNWADVYLADGVENYARSEVALDYNAGVTGNMARMSQFAPGGKELDNFPEKETREDEYFVEASVNSSGNNFTEIKAWLNNRSRWPGKTRNQMSFRYYFTKEAGTTVTASLTSTEGATITQPILITGDIYYVTISFPDVNILPGGFDDNNKPFFRKEAIFKLSSNGAWNTLNDWSFDGVARSGQANAKVAKITTYDNGVKLWGNEPGITVCDPTAIVPYFQVNSSGSWLQTTTINLKQGDGVKIGPQPEFGGSWNWTGCGVNATSRELTLKPTAHCDVVATYTNTCGTTNNITFNIKVSIIAEISTVNFSETIMKAYPNPFTHEISINFSSPTSEKLIIRVIDLKGNQVLQTDKFETNEKFQLGNELPNGVYTVVAIGENGILKVLKIEKQ